jgi:hypothetical protein
MFPLSRRRQARTDRAVAAVTHILGNYTSATTVAPEIIARHIITSLRDAGWRDSRLS